jgi:hypothetical protein
MNTNFYEVQFQEYSGQAKVNVTICIPYSEIISFMITEYPDGSVVYTPVTRTSKQDMRSLVGDAGKMHFNRWKTFKNDL